MCNLLKSLNLVLILLLRIYVIRILMMVVIRIWIRLASRLSWTRGFWWMLAATTVMFDTHFIRAHLFNFILLLRMGYLFNSIFGNLTSLFNPLFKGWLFSVNWWHWNYRFNLLLRLNNLYLFHSHHWRLLLRASDLSCLEAVDNFLFVITFAYHCFLKCFLPLVFIGVLYMLVTHTGAPRFAHDPSFFFVSDVSTQNPHFNALWLLNHF